MKNYNFYKNRLPHIDFQGAIQFITFSVDRARGIDLIADPRIAEIVEDELLRFANINYVLHAYVIMPDHVHIIIALREGLLQKTFTQRLKGATSFRINKLVGTSGTVWQKESFDRYIRNSFHFEDRIKYIHENPVVSGLCNSSGEWRFSSAYGQRKRVGD